jgi:hypothetical protein
VAGRRCRSWPASAKVKAGGPVVAVAAGDGSLWAVRSPATLVRITPTEEASGPGGTVSQIRGPDSCNEHRTARSRALSRPDVRTIATALERIRPGIVPSGSKVTGTERVSSQGRSIIAEGTARRVRGNRRILLVDRPKTFTSN